MSSSMDFNLHAAFKAAASLGDSELLAQCEMDFFIGTGPGGQHRNKTKTAVRLRHIPTGMTSAASERRSQSQTKYAALRRLRRKLAAAAAEKKERIPTVPTKASNERRLQEKRRAALARVRRLIPWDRDG